LIDVDVTEDPNHLSHGVFNVSTCHVAANSHGCA